MTTDELLRHLKIARLTPMQQEAARAFATRDNVVLLSPTGSGKTLAYLLPLLQWMEALPEAERTGVKAVVLVPSRELALQTEQVLKQTGTPLRGMSCYGGRPAMDEHRTMKALQPSLIVATPGRMNDHLRKGNVRGDEVRVLVIDEFDKSLELGFRDEMAEVLAQLPALRKRVLLSATEADEIPRFAGEDFFRVSFLEEGGADERLTLRRVASPEKDKLPTLYRLLCTLGDASTLVFVNYRESVERVVAYLRSMKLPCEAFHGGMEQPLREKALYKFRNGSCPVLVATDLAARGLDIPRVAHVVHYHLPLNEEAFTHRNGRTARWQAEGASYLILHGEEQWPAYLPADTPCFALPDDTPRPPRPQWATIYIGKGKKDKVNKVDIVGFLYKKGGLARDEVGTVDVMEHHAFVAVRRQKVRQLLTLVQGEKLKGMKTLFEEAR